MRIALTIHALHGGGAERQMTELANYLAAAKHDVTLVTLDHVEKDVYPVTAAVHRIGLDLMSHSTNLVQAWLANRRRKTKLRETLRSIRPEMIISFTDKMNILTLAAANSDSAKNSPSGPSLSCPVIIAEHSDPRRQPLSLLWETWRRFTYPKAQCILALTDAIAADLKKRFPSQMVRVLPNAIELADRPLQPPRFAKPAQPPFRAIAVGRLAKEKGFDWLIEAWSLAADRLSDWKLDIIGEGEERQRLQELIRQHQLEETVSLPGWSNDIAKNFEKADLFILSSRYEALPRSLLEAMSHQLAIVATQASDAIPILVKEQQNGWIVPVNDTDQLSRTIAQACQNIELLRTYGVCSGDIVEDYSWNKIGPKWLSLITEFSR